MRNIYLAILFIVSQNIYSQKTTFSNKGSFFVYWGYNRSWFSKSNIHFIGPEYNFSIKKATASDRPTPFDADTYLNPKNLSIPQFNVRAGFFLKENWSVSVGYDHMKYVFDSRQTAIVDGVIGENASEDYKGRYDNVEMKIPPEFVFFEHTDGLNLLSVDFEYSRNLLYLFNRNINIESNLGLGGGIVIPRTDARLFWNRGLNNRFHISGFGVTSKIGLRTNFKNKLFLLAETRQGYINLSDVLIENDTPDRAKHTFLFNEFYITLGYKFNLSKKDI